MSINTLILKLLEDQSIITSLTLLVSSLCSFGVFALNRKREQLIEVTKGAKRSSLRSEYLQIYNSTEFSLEEKWEMTRPLVKEYFHKLNGNHYIHGLDKKLSKKLNDEKKRALGSQEPSGN